MSNIRDPLYRRHRFPPEVISTAVWLYYRFPLSLRMVEEMLAARGICVSYETVRQWARKFGRTFSDQIRRRAPTRGDTQSRELLILIAAPLIALQSSHRATIALSHLLPRAGQGRNWNKPAGSH